MDTMKVMSWLSRSVCDSSILKSLVDLKSSLVEITDKDKKELFAKYPKLKEIFENLINKLS